MGSLCIIMPASMTTWFVIWASCGLLEAHVAFPPVSQPWRYMWHPCMPHSLEGACSVLTCLMALEVHVASSLASQPWRHMWGPCLPHGLGGTCGGPSYLMVLEVHATSLPASLWHCSQSCQEAYMELLDSFLGMFHVFLTDPQVLFSWESDPFDEVLQYLG